MVKIIEARTTQLGNQVIKRLLPTVEKRSIGPFIFLDYLPPTPVTAGESFDVLPHPHIGLSTLSYLFSGSIVHRDSLGVVQRVNAGDVNLMTAGRGIVHSERLPPDRPAELHSLQFWLALPEKLQDCEPSFAHCSAAQLPHFQIEKCDMRLVLGSAFGYRSGLPEHLPSFLIDLRATEKAQLQLAGQIQGELGVFVVQGSASVKEQPVSEGQLLYLAEDKIDQILIENGSHLVLIGGRPLQKPRKMFWNFAHTDPARIEQARSRWQNQQFDLIAGDSEEFVPLPQ